MLPDGTPMSYDINVVSGWSDWVSACQIMAKNLEEIGIKANGQDLRLLRLVRPRPEGRLRHLDRLEQPGRDTVSTSTAA